MDKKLFILIFFWKEKARLLVFALNKSSWLKQFCKMSPQTRATFFLKYLNTRSLEIK
jgi:hypothetical protein